MATEMNNIDIRNFPAVSSVDDYDYIILSLFSGYSRKMTVGLFRESALKGLKPSIGEDNYWYVGEESTGVLAVGQTPMFRKNNGNIEYRYDTEDDTAWRPLIAIDDLRLRYVELTDEQIYTLRMRYEDLTGEQQDTLRLKYSDLTEEQIAELQLPATEIAEEVSKAEDERAAAEEKRVAAEQARADAETERQKLEEQRSADYKAWNDAEAERQANETERIDNETKRQKTEEERMAAETERDAAETDRIQQDEIRRKWFEEIIAQLGNQTLAIEMTDDGDVNVITGETNTDFKNGYIEDNGDVVLEFNFW